MTKSSKHPLRFSALILVLLALLFQGTAFAALTFGRDKLKGTSKTQGDFNLANRFTLAIAGVTHVVVDGETNAVLAGSSVTFTAASSDSSAPTYQWQKNGVNIAGATGGSYTISNFKSSDAGTYTVVATNAAGSATSDGSVLTVKSAMGAPVFTVQPKNRSTPVGSSVTFTAAARGSPMPTYQWQKNGVSIPKATSASFTISSVGSRDAGTYTVVAANSAGSVTSTGAVLKVIESLNKQGTRSLTR
jgi:Immunoglobulin I-set domain/Immunoglobulin domain